MRSGARDEVLAGSGLPGNADGDAVRERPSFSRICFASM